MKFEYKKNNYATWSFSFGFGMGMGWLYIGKWNLFFHTNKKDAEMKKDAESYNDWEKKHPVIKCGACDGKGYIYTAQQAGSK